MTADPEIPHMAALLLSQELDLSITSSAEEGVAIAEVRLSRLQAQKLAETLVAFAEGRTTKSAGSLGFDIFFGTDTPRAAQTRH